MKPLYPGREEVLYLVAPKICELVREDLTTFSGFKKKYTEAFLDGLVQATLNAQQMPNAKSRRSKQRLKRSSLAGTNVTICSLFQDLMQYVEDGFAEKDQKDIRALAGADYYAAAANPELGGIENHAADGNGADGHVPGGAGNQIYAGWVCGGFWDTECCIW